MSQNISEFIFFKVKPEVRPEDPDNTEGRNLVGVFHTTKHQSGHQSSVWGRVKEDEDVIVWVVGMLFPQVYLSASSLYDRATINHQAGPSDLEWESKLIRSLQNGPMPDAQQPFLFWNPSSHHRPNLQQPSTQRSAHRFPARGHLSQIRLQKFVSCPSPAR